MSTRIKLRCWDILPILLLIVPVSRSEKNVALNGTAEQSTDQEMIWTADKVIDNCTVQVLGPPPHCCAHTSDKNHKEAWWRVDLGQRSTIQYITIYYREPYGFRFGGYSLYVSNSTNFIQSILCYQDNSSSHEDVDLNPTHQCPYVAQYVTVYNHREEPKRHDWYSDDAILELCEVQVFGCQIGSYGNQSCHNTCPESCYGGNCNAITGSCFYCFPGMFGDFCEQQCSANCNNTCEKDSGHCIDCVNGKYGDMCGQDCSDNCKDHSCMKNNGSCLGCITGRYGNDCTTDCSDDCKGKTCMMSNGHCIECINGKYGDVCDKDCSDSCKDRSCMKENGYCLECVPGKHGDDCTTDCSDYCRDKTCVRSNGNCIECVKGKHGDVCDHDCSDTCKDITCLKENGFCFDCIPGKTGELCTANCSSNCVTCNQTSEQCFECTPGKFGPFCTFDCLGKCKDNICQQIDGLCTGCEDGYFTDHCNRSCPSSCTTDVCDMITGYCTAPVQPTQPGSFNIAAAGIGITSGLVILTLVVLVIILVRRLSRYKRDNMNLTHMKDLSQSVRREDLQKNTEGTYDEIGSHTKTQPTETNRTDTNYEQLNALEREPSHVYETA